MEVFSADFNLTLRINYEENIKECTSTVPLRRPVLLHSTATKSSKLP